MASLLIIKAEISAGIISGNKAVEGYDKDGNVQGGNGGAISAVGSEITINESAELSNNSADNYGGAIYVEGWGTDQLKGLLSVDGGIICNNKAKKAELVFLQSAWKRKRIWM